jgi:hypothetical protein
MVLAPIVLFVYNRPEHTKKTLKALQENILSSDSDLFIYSDASKGDDSSTQVNEVRGLIKNVSGFKSATVIKQEKNQGLANSIINGVTEIVNKYGKIIVLEDDLVTSPYFLTFMNDALNFYEYKKKVWHISGWNYPISSEGLGDTFLWRTMNCWGWATWSDRWQFFEKNTVKITQDFSKKDIKYFNLDGAENFWGQVLANKEGKINTWAVYWYATIFRNKGLCLNPSQTFVDNIGLDGSGVHCGINTFSMSNLNLKKSIKFTTEFKENGIALCRIQLFYKKMKKAFGVRVINKMARIFIKKNIIK